MASLPSVYRILGLLLLMQLLICPVFSQTSEPDPDKAVAVETEPIPVNINELHKLIGYPPAARDANIQGKVVLKVLVSEDGEYIRHIVVKNPNAQLTTAVENQIEKLRFSPAIQNGKPLKYWVLIPFEFRLTEGDAKNAKNRGH